MVEDYDDLKENNLRQMVNECENARPNFVKEKQYRHNLMEEYALKQLNFAVQEDEKVLSWFMWDIGLWTKDFYENAEANLVRKYAAIYDAENLEKYPVSNPFLPRGYLSPRGYDNIVRDYVRILGGYYPFVDTTLRSLTTKHKRDYQR